MYNHAQRYPNTQVEMTNTTSVASNVRNDSSLGRSDATSAPRNCALKINRNTVGIKTASTYSTRYNAPVRSASALAKATLLSMMSTPSYVSV